MDLAKFHLVYDRGNRDFNHNSPYSKVQAPSIRDHLEHFTTLQKEISTVQGQLDSKAHQKAKIDAGMATQEQEFDYNVLLDSKNVFQAELLQWCDVHKITSAEAYALSDSYLQALRGAVTSVDIATWIKSRANNIAYGGVRFTSGYRTTAPYGPNRHIRRLDWALIEPLSGVRTGSNDVSEFLYSRWLTFRDMADPIGTQEFHGSLPVCRPKKKILLQNFLFEYDSIESFIWIRRSLRSHLGFYLTIERKDRGL